MKTIKFKASKKRPYRLVTPCPHAYGYLGNREWGFGSNVPCMVGSAICEFDCSENRGVNRFLGECICNKD